MQDPCLREKRLEEPNANPRSALQAAVRLADPIGREGPCMGHDDTYSAQGRLASASCWLQLPDCERSIENFVNDVEFTPGMFCTNTYAMNY